MGKNYYNILEFTKASSFLKKNPYEAKIRFEKYLAKYPKDYNGYAYYILSLISLELYEDAEKILDYVVSISQEDKKFMNMTDKLESFNTSIFKCRLKLLSYQGKFEELYKLCGVNLSLVKNDLELKRLYFYATVNSGNRISRERDSYSYVFRQILEYHESDFFEHTQKHLTEQIFEDNFSVFVPDFPIHEVVNEIKKYIPSNKRMCSQYFQDEYIFRYDGCGRNSDNKVVNYFMVICIHNTKDIITMYPMVEREELPYVDLNYMIKETEVKVKRRSQIDKFNQRYKKD